MGDAGPQMGNEPATHYNDWPNSVGFDTHYEERSPVELRVEGNIPAYAAGTLFRTGLGPRTIKTSKDTEFKVNHWFDNFAQVHRFQIHEPQQGSKLRVTYNSRLTSDGLRAKIKKEGKLDGFTFAAKYEPCKTFFQKMQSVFQPAQPMPKMDEVNVGVTMSANFPGLSRDGHKTERPHDPRDGLSLCNKTDANILQFIDSETLEPIGLARQETLHPDLKGVGSGAHAKSDPVTGDVYNYNLDFGRTGIYRVWCASASTGKTSILGTVYHAPAYIHSLFLTEKYVVLCVWNSFYKAGGASILWNRNLLDAMAWDGKPSTTWFVIDKTPPEKGGKGVIATYDSDAFFAFHSINAYEEPSTTKEGAVDIVCDVLAYDDMRVIYDLFLDNIISDSPKAHTAKKSENSIGLASYRRYRLPVLPATAETAHSKGVLEFHSGTAEGFELPIINPGMVTKKHRYIYGISDTGKSTLVDGLMKYDAATRTVLRWSVHGQSPGEPVYIPNPEGKDEDDGVLLTVVLDGPGGKSYLLVLDAKTMTEVGRAHVDGVVGFGFHGLYVSSGTPVGGANGLHL